MKETGQPQILTVNGRAEVVVQDVASYQRLLDQVDRAEAIEGIRRGLESAARGEGRPAEEIYAELRTRHRLARRVSYRVLIQPPAANDLDAAYM